MITSLQVHHDISSLIVTYEDSGLGLGLGDLMQPYKGVLEAFVTYVPCVVATSKV